MSSKKKNKNLPGLIYEKAEFKTHKKQSQENQENEYYNYKKDSRHIYLWTGVIILSLAIFSMWVWNASVILYDFNSEESEAKKIVETAKADLGDILTSLEKENSNQVENSKTDNKNEEGKDEEDKKTKKWLGNLIHLASSKLSSSTPESSTTTKNSEESTTATTTMSN